MHLLHQQFKAAGVVLSAALQHKLLEVVPGQRKPQAVIAALLRGGVLQRLIVVDHDGPSPDLALAVHIDGHLDLHLFGDTVRSVPHVLQFFDELIPDLVRVLTDLFHKIHEDLLQLLVLQGRVAEGLDDPGQAVLIQMDRQRGALLGDRVRLERLGGFVHVVDVVHNGFHIPVEHFLHAVAVRHDLRKVLRQLQQGDPGGLYRNGTAAHQIPLVDPGVIIPDIRHPEVDILPVGDHIRRGDGAFVEAHIQLKAHLSVMHGDLLPKSGALKPVHIQSHQGLRQLPHRLAHHDLRGDLRGVGIMLRRCPLIDVHAGVDHISHGLLLHVPVVALR